jgi:hypothetical protein
MLKMPKLFAILGVSAAIALGAARVSAAADPHFPTPPWWHGTCGLGCKHGKWLSNWVYVNSDIQLIEYREGNNLDSQFGLGSSGGRCYGRYLFSKGQWREIEGSFVVWLSPWRKKPFEGYEATRIAKQIWLLYHHTARNKTQISTDESGEVQVCLKRGGGLYRCGG